MKPRFFYAFLPLLLLALPACGGGPAPTDSAPATEAAVETLEPTDTPAPSPSPTTPPPLVILIAPEGADPDIRQAAEMQGAALAADRGWRWQVRQAMSPAEVAFEGDYIIALPPQEDLNALVSAAPQAHFLAIGVSGVAPADNLILVRTELTDPAIGAFMGGYIGATITRDWRIGIITTEDDFTTDRFTAFENGMRFFCGLCRPQYAPFYEYPFLLSLAVGSSDVEWRSLADFMRDRLVGTVYVSPGAGTPDMLSTLAELGVNIIGSTPPPPGLEANWVAALRAEPAAAYAEYLPRLLDGETGLEVNLPIQVLDVNPALLGQGRIRLAEETLQDLTAGFILPGVPAPVEP